ncbi:MAG: hypothetical protein R3E79_00360 [Caldilineaceae bacterium]
MSVQPENKRWIGFSTLASLLLAVGYGVLLRYLFHSEPSGALMVTLSFAFLLLGPLAMGALAVWFAPVAVRTAWRAVIGIGALACLLWLVVVLLLAWEVAICIAMALPIVLPMTILGSVIVGVLTRRGIVRQQFHSFVLGLFLLAPYAVGPLEQRFPQVTTLQRVETTITIRADAETVWRNIICVPPIQPDEREVRLYHLAGFPWPEEATMTVEGVGGVRTARYENGLTFAEPVTAWEPYRTFRFDIQVVEPEKLPMPWNGIGGPYFDVLYGQFLIEPLRTDEVRLYLISTHRLTTRFNEYGGLWTRFFLNDFQEYILGVVKTRAEEEYAQAVQ